jgi:hypothetical protein
MDNVIKKKKRCFDTSEMLDTEIRKERAQLGV